MKHTGELLNVNVISVDEKITYTYPNETVNSIAKSCVKEIVFRSGRKEKISEKITVNNEYDWENVIITTNVEDIRCLVRKGDISVSANNYWNFNSTAGVDIKATKKIKKEAAP